MAEKTISESIPIVNDPYYQLCESLALLSKGDERYGCVIARDGEVQGFGFNRAVSHPAFRLERVIRQGYGNHAELEGMNYALMNSKRREEGAELLKGSDVFVAGYFPESGRLFFQDKYTCIRCPPHMENYEIRSVNIPMPKGWVRRSIDEALDEAWAFTNGTHQKRLNAAVGNFTINMISDRLLDLRGTDKFLGGVPNRF